MLVTDTLQILIHPLKFLVIHLSNSLYLNSLYSFEYTVPTCLNACPESSNSSNNLFTQPFWLRFNIDSICGDCVKCAAKAAIGLKCSVSSLAAPVSLRQSTNAETDTSLGGRAAI